MKAMMSIGLLLMMLLPIGRASEEVLSVELVDNSDHVEVLVRNRSDHALDVNRRLAVGLIERGADVEFVILAVPGREQARITAAVEPWPLKDADKVELRPNEIIGVAVRKCFLAQLYSLTPGAYVIKARYTPEMAWEPFVKSLTYESAWVTILIDAASVDAKSCFGP